MKRKDLARSMEDLTDAGPRFIARQGQVDLWAKPIRLVGSRDAVT
jgi:hypothetical protein